MERSDNIGTALDGGGEPAGLPGLPGRVHHAAWHHVQLFGVVKVPPDLHRPVLQTFQFHWATQEREAELGPARSGRRQTLGTANHKAHCGHRSNVEGNEALGTGGVQGARYRGKLIP